MQTSMQKNIKNNNGKNAIVAFKLNNCTNDKEYIKDFLSLNIKRKQDSFTDSKTVNNICDISYEKVKRYKLKFILFLKKVRLFNFF